MPYSFLDIFSYSLAMLAYKVLTTDGSQMSMKSRRVYSYRSGKKLWESIVFCFSCSSDMVGRIRAGPSSQEACFSLTILTSPNIFLRSGICSLIFLPFFNRGRLLPSALVF